MTDKMKIIWSQGEVTQIQHSCVAQRVLVSHQAAFPTLYKRLLQKRYSKYFSCLCAFVAKIKTSK